GGMSWGFGDDWLWQFRKVEERIQVVRRNVRFTAAKGSPEARAVELAYTDSVLFSLPIVSKNPDGVDIVDLSTVFMGDLPQISNVLSGFTFSRDKSSWATVKSFKDNVELEVAATYSSSGKTGFDTVADSRGVTVNVHYSISLLPETGYTPRMGDDRVGYFLTATKDFSKKSGHDRFVRYVNRWDLRKSDASAELSPPKKPIVFWIEKTVPYEYRKPIREGILEWNRAFEAVGIANAIEVRQQPDDAEWEPEDINYNTFRWITSGAGFAMGPSRVNPTTGEILDADIIFDADFLLFYQEDYDVLTVDEPSDSIDGRFGNCGSSRCGCTLNRDIARELAFGWALLEGQEPSVAEEAKKTLVTQALKETAMHEVGHTLGLRHNFRASAWLSAEEMADHEKTASTGLAASVMDYLPMNIVPRKDDQGDYFSRTIGPYDHWAIEYGYRLLDGGTEGERADLQKIAARCAEPALAYATDEDTRSNDPDPLVNRFDLGKDPLEFAKLRLELIGEALPGLVERLAAEGEDYHRVRRAFNILLSLRASAMHFAARHIGGLYVHRHHRGDPDARPPFVVVEAAKQREALALLEEHVFGETAYQFPPDLYAHLSPAWWSHWGTTANPRTDYPIHEVILTWQSRVLSQLLSSITLERLIDSELKVPADQDAFTAAEMIERLTSAIFGEVEG
ncbi:MAG: zinc-dependent metalloprotease, partial [Planctomycetes bacterium]|nr:zinc-dependent metalloprotease [Planctomycetota bacterium]